MIFEALPSIIDRPEAVRPAPGVPSTPVVYFGTPVYSSARPENFSYTPISSAAFDDGWKNVIGGATLPIGSSSTCQIFHGYISEMLSPVGIRDTLTTTCGPELMPKLPASERAAALHMSEQSDIKS